jgi:hypothetical protein
MNSCVITVVLHLINQHKNDSDALMYCLSKEAKSIPLDCWLGLFHTHCRVRVMFSVEDPTVTIKCGYPLFFFCQICPDHDRNQTQEEFRHLIFLFNSFLISLKRTMKRHFQ